MSIPIVIIMGPTASGKTELSIPLAQALDAEIISCDSMQIYRGMDIGTSKPTIEERQSVVHHLIDICDPWESYSSALFVRDASAKIREIHERGHRVLIVGGTVLYIKNLLEGIFSGPGANWELRQQLSARAVENLYQELCQIDAATAQKISQRDKRRIIRAIEIFHTTGVPISQCQQQDTAPTMQFAARFIGVHWNREILYRRIEERVIQMLASGLVAEVEALLNLPHPLSHTASQAIGYKEIICALQQQQSITDATALIQRNTKRFAKRQLTWLRRFPIHWASMTPERNIGEVTEEMLHYLRT